MSELCGVSSVSWLSCRMSQCSPCPLLLYFSESCFLCERNVKCPSQCAFPCSALFCNLCLTLDLCLVPPSLIICFIHLLRRLFITCSQLEATKTQVKAVVLLLVNIKHVFWTGLFVVSVQIRLGVDEGRGLGRRREETRRVALLTWRLPLKIWECSRIQLLLAVRDSVAMTTQLHAPAQGRSSSSEPGSTLLIGCTGMGEEKNTECISK